MENWVLVKIPNFKQILANNPEIFIFTYLLITTLLQLYCFYQ